MFEKLAIRNMPGLHNKRQNVLKFMRFKISSTIFKVGLCLLFCLTLLTFATEKEPIYEGSWLFLKADLKFHA